MLSILNSILHSFLSIFILIILTICIGLCLQFLLPSFEKWIHKMIFFITLSFMLQPAIGQITSVTNTIHVMGTSFLSIYPILSAIFLTASSSLSLLNFQPAMLLFAYGAIYLSEKLLIPLLLTALLFDISSKINPEINFTKLADLCRMTLFGAVSAIAATYSIFITVGGTLNWALSGITSEPIQQLIQQNIPFIGSFLTESIRSLGQHTSTMSVLTGSWLIGTLWIVALLPTLKTLIIALSYRWFAALLQPITDKTISDMIDDVGKTLLVLCSITFIIAFAFIYTSIFMITIVKLMIATK